MSSSCHKMAVEVDHYVVLGLPSGEEGAKLTEKDITKGYKAMALQLHPDKRPGDPNAHSDFLQLQNSYEVLKDENSRLRFDHKLRLLELELQRKKAELEKRQRLAREQEERAAREKLARQQEWVTRQRLARQEEERAARQRLARQQERAARHRLARKEEERLARERLARQEEERAAARVRSMNGGAHEHDFSSAGTTYVPNMQQTRSDLPEDDDGEDLFEEYYCWGDEEERLCAYSRRGKSKNLRTAIQQCFEYF